MSTTKPGKILLHVAAVVFLVNTATAYGACCFVMPADTPVAVEMPCHETAENHDSTASAEGCCLFCLSMSGQPEAQRQVTAIAPTLHLPAIVPFASMTFAPPFQAAHRVTFVCFQASLMGGACICLH